MALGVDRSLAQNLRGREETVKVVKRQHDRFLGQVRDLLEKVTIRRNRLDLLNDPIYRETLPPLSKVCDPTREYFALDNAQDAFYDSIVTEVFGGLAPKWLAPVYQPEDYRTKKSKEGATQGNIRENMRRMLVRRFESSFAAFAQSLENMCAMYRNAEAFVLKTRTFFYAREEMEKLMEITDPEAFQEAYEAIEAELLKRSQEEGKTSVYELDGANFNGKVFLEAIKLDIMLFGTLQKEMKRLRLLDNDPKSARLVEVCRDILAGKALKDSNPAAPKRKILIFSEFADTVAFLSGRLEAAFPGRVCVVRDLGTAKREELRANFDASCPKAQQRDDYDILLGTDKISEGLNLNRAGVVVNYDIPWNPTRVLQRLGRINRIGGKVFEELHTVNFFPTKRGADLVGNERIAREKLFNIQKTLGEDVKLFDEGEEPTPAELWERLNGNKEEAGAITKWRGLHAELTRRDPELFARVRERAPNAKSARAAAPGIAPGTYQLRTIGALPQALAVSPEGATHAIAPTALLQALRCEEGEPLDKTAVHGKTFWDALSTLANYRDASPAWVSPTFGAARDNLALVEQRAPALAADVRAVRKALNEGRLANWWVKQLAKRPFSHDTATEAEIATYAKTLRGVLADFRLAGTAASEPPRPVTQLSVALSGPEQDQFR